MTHGDVIGWVVLLVYVVISVTAFLKLDTDRRSRREEDDA